MSLPQCVKCDKKLPDDSVKCLKCSQEYCSRKCQVKNLSRHKHYCQKTPHQIISALIDEIETELKCYCYLKRKLTDSKLNHMLIISDKSIADEHTKLLPIQFGKIADESVNKYIPVSLKEYTIYVNTKDYRGYFRYPMENISKLDELDGETIPNKMVINLVKRKTYCW